MKNIFYLILAVSLLVGISFNFASPTPILADTVITRYLGYSTAPFYAELCAESWGDLHDVYFEWGSDTDYGYQTGTVEPFGFYYWPGDFRTHHLYEATINHIYAVGATVHFRMRGLADITNDEVVGGDATFRVAEIDQRAFATTDLAQNITHKTARLTGDLTDTLGDVGSFDVWFQWGTSISYGNEAPAIPQVDPSDVANRFYTADIAFNYAQGTEIHWRIVADATGVYGNDSIIVVPADSVGIPLAGQFNRSQSIYNIDSNWNQITTYNGTYYDYDHWYLGSGYGGGIKFSNIDVPPGCRITSAYIVFPAGITPSLGTTWVTSNITGEKTANAADFYGMPNFIQRRGTIVGGNNNNDLTSNSVSWTWNSDPGGDQTPDISPVLQEIIDQPAWATGNSAVFFIDDFAMQTLGGDYYIELIMNGSTSYYGDNLRMYTPYLHVEYDPILTLTTSIVSSSTAQGTITQLGGTPTNAHGFVWDTASHNDPGNVAPESGNYTHDDIVSGNLTGSTFDRDMSDLSHGTYYVRAVAHDDVGWAYGNEVTLTISALVLWYQPNAVISGATLPNRASSSDNGTITWGSNPSGISVILGNILSGNRAILNYVPPTPTSLLGGDFAFPPQMYTELDTSKIPGGDVVNEILGQSDTPPALWWFTFIFLLICIVGLLVYDLTQRTGGEGSLLLMCIIMEAGLVLFGVMGTVNESSIIPLFPIFLFPIPAVALILSRRHVGWG